MNPFPEEFELIGFFESEPEVTDCDVPRPYNRLTFRTKRADDSIVCTIEPGYGAIDLTWRRLGKKMLTFSLRDVSSLFIQLDAYSERMTAKFKHEDILDFVFQLKPEIKVQWGNQERL
jgi:hypothetical protein